MRKPWLPWAVTGAAGGVAVATLASWDLLVAAPLLLLAAFLAAARVPRAAVGVAAFGVSFAVAEASLLLDPNAPAPS